MEAKQSRKWREDNKFRFCQLKKDSAIHNGIIKPQYDVMFGKKFLYFVIVTQQYNK